MSADEEIVSFAPEQRFRRKVAARFERLQRELAALVPGADIQHVGSTAVPGSLTKGDLDIQIRVTAEQYAPAAELLRQRYQVNDGGFRGNDAISFEDYGSEPSVGIHLTVIDSRFDLQWRFRDRLMASDSLKKEYDDLKRRFEGGSMTQYRETKAAFVTKALVGEQGMTIDRQTQSAHGIRFSIRGASGEVGRAYLYIMNNDLHEAPFGLLEDVHVAESERGEGLGTALVNEAIAAARAAGCYKLIATSRAARPKVHALYERLGFQNYGLEFRMNLDEGD